MTTSRPVSVLVVDDHVMFAEGRAAALGTRDDVDVIGVAATGAEAEAAAVRDRPDVVLIDYGLPDDNGASVSQRLRASCPETKVIMITSLVDERIVLSAIEAGCSGYITKDRTVDDVAAAVLAAHAGEILLSPSMLARLLPRLRRQSHEPGHDLTARELDVLALICEGLANQDIAERLHLSNNTIRTHVQSILTKLRVHSKLEAAVTAVRLGLVEMTSTR